MVVQAWPGRAIAHLGFMGYAPTGDMIQLTFDTDNSDCARNLDEPLERTIVHELHHVLRWRGPDMGAHWVRPSSPKDWQVTSRNNFMAVLPKGGNWRSTVRASLKRRVTHRQHGRTEGMTMLHGSLDGTGMARILSWIFFGWSVFERSSR